MMNDAIEYASYYLAAKADDCYKRALKEDSLGNRVAAMQQLDRSVEILLDVDKLLASHPLYRLEEWVDMARDWGKTDLEKDAMRLCQAVDYDMGWFPRRLCRPVLERVDKGLLYSPYEVVFFGTAGRFGPLGGKIG